MQFILAHLVILSIYCSAKWESLRVRTNVCNVQVEFVESLPKTVSGKVQRSELRKRELSKHDA